MSVHNTRVFLNYKLNVVQSVRSSSVALLEKRLSTQQCNAMCRMALRFYLKLKFVVKIQLFTFYIVFNDSIE